MARKKEMNIFNEIIDWVEDKPLFWKISIDRLIKNNDLTDSDVSEIIKVCKNETALKNIENDTVDLAALRKFTNDSTNNNCITLSKIFNIENINALSKDSNLDFSPTALTAVYGDNGSGKSSYVSILKHICRTRGPIPSINSNLFEPSSIGSNKSASVEYRLDGKNIDIVKLHNSEISDSILKSAQVFDSFSAIHYIESEDEIAFIPHGLSIIEKFATNLKNIENKIKLEIKNLESAKVDFSILQLENGSEAKVFIETLSANTTLNELRTKVKWNEEKDNKISELTKNINELKGKDPLEEIKANQIKIERFTILMSKFQYLEDNLLHSSIDKIKSALNQFEIKSQTSTDASEKIFSGLPFDGVGNETWKQLWESARKFYNESRKKELFPEVKNDSHCPLCLQVLDAKAKGHFTDFENFVKNDIQKEYNDSLDTFNNTRADLIRLSFNFEDIEPIVKELEGLHEGYKEIQTIYLKDLLDQKNYLLKILDKKEAVDSLQKPNLENNARTFIENLIANLKIKNKDLAKHSIEDTLKPLQKELFELINQKIISLYKRKIAREIYRQKKVSFLDQCSDKCNTRTVTTLSNRLTTTYVNQMLRDSFEAELNKLGFNNIKIKTATKGVRGKQYHFLQLDEHNAENISIKEILSEGEYRCIALASFLSEISIINNQSTIIFDDPVSSLDHKWRNKIARRIVEIAKDRQVIVFTHDITFLMMLQEQSDELSCPLEIKSITRKKTETGIIASNPPWDALPVRKRIGILKNEIQTLEKIERTDTEEAYRERIKPFYGRLRETWERFVEEILLNKVVQRFSREIQTQRLKLLTDISEHDYEIIDKNMRKCSIHFQGHDSAGSLIENIPNSSEAESDINIIEEYLSEMRSRKRN